MDPTESQDEIQDQVVNDAYKDIDVTQKETNQQFFNQTNAVFGNKSSLSYQEE